MKTALLFALLLASTARAQTLEIKAGDSTLLESSGGEVTAYFPSTTTSLSAGLASGHVVVGADVVHGWHGWEIGLGDTVFNFSMPGSGLGLATRGLTFTKQTKNRTFTLFTGLAGAMYSAPYFQTVDARNFAAGAMFTQRWGNLEFASMEIVAGNQKTASEGIAYHGKKISAEGGGGLLQNEPYLFGSFAAQPIKPVFFNLGHSDSFYAGERFTVDSGGAALAAGPLTFSADAFEGSTPQGTTTGQTFGVGARVGMVLANASYMRSDYGNLVTGTATENLGQHFHLSQYATREQGHTSVTAGGGYIGNKFTAEISYNEYFMPLNVGRLPFQRALTIQLSIHAPHDIALNASTYLLPSGALRWTAFADTFAHGPFKGNAPGRVEEGNTGKYTTNLLVLDVQGEPVEGATIYIGKELCITNSQGTCFIRSKKGRALPVRVAVDEFSAAGTWRVVLAPATATPASDAVKIVVKRQP